MKNKHVLHIRSLRLHLIAIVSPTICRAMLSFLILRLACLTLQIIHTNTTCSRSLLYVVMRHQPLQEQFLQRSRS